MDRNECCIKLSNAITTQLKKTLFSTKSFNTMVQCTLPYAGEKKEYTVKEINKEFKKLKRRNLKTRFAFKAKRLSSCSNLTDPIKKNTFIMLFMKSNALTDCDKKYIMEKLGEELKSSSKNTLDKITAHTF